MFVCDAAWYFSRGSETEQEISNAADWIAFAISVVFLVYYAYA